MNELNPNKPQIKLVLKRRESGSANHLSSQDSIASQTRQSVYKRSMQQRIAEAASLGEVLPKYEQPKTES